MNESLNHNVIRRIEDNKGEIVDLGETLAKCPESGFKEVETAKVLSDRMKQLISQFNDIAVTSLEFKDITGLKYTVDTGRPGPAVAIVSELDAIITPQHPDANKTTGAVHACGHNCQMTTMFGAAIGLLDQNVLKHLCGKIHFIAVPAEELIELSFREDLQKKGIIKYLGGKTELLHRGWFDDVDICLTVHSSTIEKAGINKSYNGCLLKKVEYKGKATHAASPSKSVNALYAANLGMAAINSIRETFRESDFIRVHPIITKGGDIVNVIPDDVRVETFVRSKTLEGIEKTNKKVDRAFAAGALALGAKVKITDYPGYMPLNTDDNLNEITKQVLTELGIESQINPNAHATGSTDVGDLSSLMPVTLTWIGGVEGVAHSADYKVVDPDTAYVLGGKITALMTVVLLSDNGSKAAEVLEKFEPIFKSKKEYLKYIDDLSCEKTYDQLLDYFE